MSTLCKPHATLVRMPGGLLLARETGPCLRYADPQDLDRLDRFRERRALARRMANHLYSENIPDELLGCLGGDISDLEDMALRFSRGEAVSEPQIRLRHVPNTPSDAVLKRNRNGYRVLKYSLKEHGFVPCSYEYDSTYGYPSYWQEVHLRTMKPELTEKRLGKKGRAFIEEVIKAAKKAEHYRQEHPKSTWPVNVSLGDEVYTLSPSDVLNHEKVLQAAREHIDPRLHLGDKRFSAYLQSIKRAPIHWFKEGPASGAPSGFVYNDIFPVIVTPGSAKQKLFLNRFPKPVKEFDPYNNGRDYWD